MKYELENYKMGPVQEWKERVTASTQENGWRK